MRCAAVHGGDADSGVLEIGETHKLGPSATSPHLALVLPRHIDALTTWVMVFQVKCTR